MDVEAALDVITTQGIVALAVVLGLAVIVCFVRGPRS